MRHYCISALLGKATHEIHLCWGEGNVSHFTQSVGGGFPIPWKWRMEVSFSEPPPPPPRENTCFCAHNASHTRGVWLPHGEFLRFIVDSGRCPSILGDPEFPAVSADPSGSGISPARPATLQPNVRDARGKLRGERAPCPPPRVHLPPSTSVSSPAGSSPNPSVEGFTEGPRWIKSLSRAD